MTTLNLKKYSLALPLSAIASMIIALLVWLVITNGIGMIDPGIIQVMALAFCAWLLLLAIIMAIIGKLLSAITLQIQHFFKPIQKLTSWQQYVLYLALFALLVLSGTGCLIAIC